MQVRKEEIVCRRATVDDVSALVDYRVRFLDELFNHPEDDETAVVRKSLLEYFTRAIPSKGFIAWVAEYNGKIIGTGGMVVWEKPAIQRSRIWQTRLPPELLYGPRSKRERSWYEIAERSD